MQSNSIKGDADQVISAMIRPCISNTLERKNCHIFFVLRLQGVFCSNGGAGFAETRRGGIRLHLDKLSTTDDHNATAISAKALWKRRLGGKALHMTTCT
mmetsp:Transcript_55019/g.90707  ORF Transcript_55019/g.90707 Transcript_55019/m.90707 type:complete len:99 (+) Transcript_55019:2556-2852(+)